MNKVEIRAEEVPLPAWSDCAADFCRVVMEQLRFSRRVLSVLFCGDQFIRALNLRFRNVDESTDVLSFPYVEMEGEAASREEGFVPAGDVVVSLEELRRFAAEAGVDEALELRRVLIHGILHLAGFDHATNEQSEPMLVYQEALLKELPSWKMTV
ncbi:MAG: rRNA maturation RNase YbeY [Spirochaetaceae bacterium]|jgi:probable rRNA maturation factor|nr:rRNA maturation RNase YbeY [Spirochaetaceae bacterium]